MVPSRIPTMFPSLVPTLTPTRKPTVLPSYLPSVEPTVLPSVNPSVVPSVSPTIQPSIVPSVSPSVTPTLVPSIGPSVGPTKAPTFAPTVAPSVMPSLSPSVGPSIAPSIVPSIAPSIDPSIAPSIVPSIAPSIDPSIAPSIVPSIAPSITPSFAPSVTPSFSPSVGPSFAPSFTPTVEPSSAPTVDPSVMPSLAPSVMPSVPPSTYPSIIPSITPTKTPSTGPTVVPSDRPSIIPSLTPSLLPIVCPTQTPTVSPSILPTVRPSIQPSLQPSVVPTTVPSLGPSIVPTLLPSFMPSALPTIEPSVEPTLSPSILPSVTPTVGPSLLPSLLPTFLPSTEPSMDPSVYPSASPSIEPSVVSTLLPSLLPSVKPTRNPTTSPSVVPSKGPTADPSRQPSIHPSLLPSFEPTALSKAPSVTTKPSAPTVAPSRNPTLGPSLKTTQGPSVNPSVKPTRSPTTLPSVKPTGVPSVKPSLNPSVKPSVRPTLSPTSPTVSPTQPRPSISPSPTITPSLSLAPMCDPTTSPTDAPTAAPSVLPSTCLPSTVLPSESPSVLPSVLPTFAPSTQAPTGTPSTQEFYESHVKATLPSNQSISVLGLNTNAFKVVLPFLSISDGPSGTAYSDVTVTSGFNGKLFLIPGSPAPPSPINAASGGAFVGAVSLDSSKRSVSVLSDFNGDGFDDLIIGDPYVSKCYVMFGTAEGLMGMTKGFTIFGEFDGDLTGWSVSSAGDVNNDTVSDIIVGAPFARRTGAFYVIYGRNKNIFDVNLNNLTVSLGFAVYGGQKSDYLGISVSGAGDFNKDGYGDVIAGAVLTSLHYCGAAYVMYGGPSMASLQSVGLLSPGQGFKTTGPSYMYAGYTVTGAGDVNKDGYADVLIGSNSLKPTEASLTFIVYGTVSPNNLMLTALTASQGIRISGSGVAVSVATDIDGDGFDDILVGGNYSTFGSNVGYIVFTSVGQFTKITGNPTVLPTFTPSVVPTVRPTTRTPVLPSVRPTRLPSEAPSFTPSAPTDAPTVGVTEPTSHPSSRPTFPTLAPSQQPSEAPTESPTQEPSEKPTLIPSAEPSETPTVSPSESPSVVPTYSDTRAPSTVGPTQLGLTRNPVGTPSVMPTAWSTSQGTSAVITIDTPNAVIIQSIPNIVYRVNCSGNVTIDNSEGGNQYALVPRENSKLTIVHFDASSDKIDVTAFTIDNFAQLVITEGSVVITFPSKQVIHLLNLHPSDISASNFVFTVIPGGDESKPPFVSTELIIFATVFGGIGVLISLYYFINRFLPKPKRVCDKVYIMTVLNNADESEAKIDHEAQLMDAMVDCFFLKEDFLEEGSDCDEEAEEHIESPRGSLFSSDQLSDESMDRQQHLQYHPNGVEYGGGSVSAADLSDHTVDTDCDMVQKVMRVELGTNNNDVNQLGCEEALDFHLNVNYPEHLNQMNYHKQYAEGIQNRNPERGDFWYWPS